MGDATGPSFDGAAAALWIGPPRRGPGRLVGALAGAPARLVSSRGLIATCVARSLSARFRGTALGFLWPLVHPLALFAVYGFLFARLLGLGLPGSAGDVRGSYGVYLFTGALVWSAFADAVTRATSSVVEGRHLVRQLAFPGEVLPLVAAATAVITLSYGVGAFTVGAVFTPLWPAPTTGLLWIPLLVLLQLSFTYGIGLALSSLHVGLRDTGELVGVALTVLMFATPVFWVPSVEVFPGLAEWMPLIEANPLHHLVSAWRGALLSGMPDALPGASIGASVASFAPWAVGALVLGRVVFAAFEPEFADEL